MGVKMSNSSNSKNDLHPPKFAKRIVKLLSRREQNYSLLHNLEEEYRDVLQSEGKRKADKWFRHQVIKSIPMLFKFSIYWGAAMFKSYFTIAVRNIKKYKGYSFINITGLAVGLACSLLIFLFVQHELSYE